MLILNFTHPLTGEHKAQIETLAEATIDEIRLIPVQIAQAQPLEKQIREIVDAIGLTSEEWQTRPLLINPPGYASAAFVLLAELHGRIGQFPVVMRLRPKAGTLPAYEGADLFNLQTVREESRKHR